MASRFNFRLPANEVPDVLAGSARCVKGVTEGEWVKEGAEALPVVVRSCSAKPKAFEALGPRLGAVAEKFSGKACFVKVLQAVTPGPAAEFGVTESRTVVSFRRGKESGERLGDGDIKPKVVTARIEAMLGGPAAAPPG